MFIRSLESKNDSVKASFDRAVTSTLYRKFSKGRAYPQRSLCCRSSNRHLRIELDPMRALPEFGNSRVEREGSTSIWTAGSTNGSIRKRQLEPPRASCETTTMLWNPG